jgi:hypothetical protein
VRRQAQGSLCAARIKHQTDQAFACPRRGLAHGRDYTSVGHQQEDEVFWHEVGSKLTFVLGTPDQLGEVAVRASAAVLERLLERLPEVRRPLNVLPSS